MLVRSPFDSTCRIKGDYYSVHVVGLESDATLVGRSILFNYGSSYENNEIPQRKRIDITVNYTVCRNRIPGSLRRLTLNVITIVKAAPTPEPRHGPHSGPHFHLRPHNPARPLTLASRLPFPLPQHASLTPRTFSGFAFLQPSSPLGPAAAMIRAHIQRSGGRSTPR
ncbi:hypothetical protein J6590_007815 [Homalodisca vitripennis]|nr:hypothetical protein J6590_007815 [Homalodisca vitripennis]